MRFRVNRRQCIALACCALTFVITVLYVPRATRVTFMANFMSNTPSGSSRRISSGRFWNNPDLEPNTYKQSLSHYRWVFSKESRDFGFKNFYISYHIDWEALVVEWVLLILATLLCLSMLRTGRDLPSPRFSLRSLIILIALIGSVYGLKSSPLVPSLIELSFSGVLIALLAWSIHHDIMNLKTAAEPDSAPPQIPASRDQLGG